MARSLSLVRRRANLVDLTLQARAGVAAYQFFSSTNFDVAFTQFETVPAYGKASKTVLNTSYTDGNYRNQTRFVFDPADYALNDSAPIWIQIKQVSTSGVVGPFEARHLVLPYSSQPNRPLVISGLAPSAIDISGSMELQLPMQCNNMRVQVDGANDLYLAFESSGPEQRVPSLASEFTDVMKTFESFYQIFVRGGGASTAFSLTAALRNNPT
jgi:hypothetical protein